MTRFVFTIWYRLQKPGDYKAPNILSRTYISSVDADGGALLHWKSLCHYFSCNKQVEKVFGNLIIKQIKMKINAKTSVFRIPLFYCSSSIVQTPAHLSSSADSGVLYVSSRRPNTHTSILAHHHWNNRVGSRSWDPKGRKIDFHISRKPRNFS
jgi:hypothetical protein